MKILFGFFVLMIVISCNSENKNLINIVSDKSGSEIENNLKLQLKEYLTAINGGDADKAISYIYPDVFVYMQQKYPKEYSISNIKKEMREPIEKMKKLVQQKKITYDFEIGDFVTKIDLGKDKIYTIIANINAKSGLNKHTIGQEVICISTNNGKDWKFMELKNEMAEPILRIKFPEKTVSKIFTNKTTRN